MEDGEGIFAIIHTASREDDRDEVNAGIIE